MSVQLRHLLSSSHPFALHPPVSPLSLTSPPPPSSRLNLPPLQADVRKVVRTRWRSPRSLLLVKMPPLPDSETLNDWMIYWLHSPSVCVCIFHSTLSGPITIFHGLSNVLTSPTALTLEKVGHCVRRKWKQTVIILCLPTTVWQNVKHMIVWRVSLHELRDK